MVPPIEAPGFAVVADNTRVELTTGAWATAATARAPNAKTAFIRFIIFIMKRAEGLKHSLQVHRPTGISAYGGSFEDGNTYSYFLRPHFQFGAIQEMIGNVLIEIGPS